MKSILKSLLLFSILGFGLEAMASSLGIQKLKNGALNNMQELKDGTLEVIDTMEFSGSVALVESEGSKDILIDEARAQVKIPISKDVAILLQADARQALGRNLETSEDNVDDGQDKLKKALGLSVAFDVDVNDNPVMILAGKFDHVNFPLFSLGPRTAEEDELAVERGATGVSFVVPLTDSMPKHIAKTVFKGAVLNRNEDRDMSDHYFDTENVGYNIALTHKFLNNTLGMSYTTFNDTVGVEDNSSMFISQYLSPRTNVWGRLLSVTNDLGGEDSRMEDTISLGMNQKVNSQLILFGRTDYTDDSTIHWRDNHRTSVGAVFSPYSTKGPSVGMEVYNRQYKNPNIEDEASLRTFINFDF